MRLFWGCCRLPRGSGDVLPQEDLGRAGLSPDRAKPAGRGPGPPAGDRHPRASGRARGERSVGAAGALGRAVRDPGDGAERGAGRRDGGGPADRAGPGVRALVGRDRLPGGDRGRGQGAQARVRAGAGDLPHRAAPADGRRLRPGGRSLARGLPDRRRRGAGAPPSLSGDGVARRGIAGAGAGRPHAVRPALHQGPGRGAAVRPPARSVQPARSGVHGHHQPLLRRRGRADPRPPRPQQGPSPGPPPDDPGGPDRWRRAAGLLGDVARQYGRRHHADPGDRPAAPALRDRPDLRGRRPRHDQRRDRGGARGAQAALSARHPRAHRQGGARSSSSPTPRPACR